MRAVVSSWCLGGYCREKYLLSIQVTLLIPLRDHRLALPHPFPVPFSPSFSRNGKDFSSFSRSRRAQKSRRRRRRASARRICLGKKNFFFFFKYISLHIANKSEVIIIGRARTREIAGGEDCVYVSRPFFSREIITLYYSGIILTLAHEKSVYEITSFSFSLLCSYLYIFFFFLYADLGLVDGFLSGKDRSPLPIHYDCRHYYPRVLFHRPRMCTSVSVSETADRTLIN